jgi:hypothetical protein
MSQDQVGAKGINWSKRSLATIELYKKKKKKEREEYE